MNFSLVQISLFIVITFSYFSPFTLQPVDIEVKPVLDLSDDVSSLKSEDKIVNNEESKNEIDSQVDLARSDYDLLNEDNSTDNATDVEDETTVNTTQESTSISKQTDSAITNSTVEIETGLPSSTEFYFDPKTRPEVEPGIGFTILAAVLTMIGVIFVVGGMYYFYKNKIRNNQQSGRWMRFY